MQTLSPYLTRGDIVIDESNENYLVTQERQAVLQPRGVSYIGMGVSGGFSGARHEPSLMSGGDEWALDRLLPLLSKIAAKDEQSRPCVAKIGSGESGHYVKMIHNGIEHGMMSVLCEAWELMDQCLGMDGEHIAAVFEAWCSEGELVCPIKPSSSCPSLTPFIAKQLPCCYQRTNLSKKEPKWQGRSSERHTRCCRPGRERLGGDRCVGQSRSHQSPCYNAKPINSPLCATSIFRYLAERLDQDILGYTNAWLYRYGSRPESSISGEPEESCLRFHPRLLRARSGSIGSGKCA